MERIFWAKRSVVMDDFPVESDRIAGENLRNETIYKLVLFVNICVVVHKHSGDHDKSASGARQITSSIRIELSMPTLSCRANSLRGHRGGWIPAKRKLAFLDRFNMQCFERGEDQEKMYRKRQHSKIREAAHARFVYVHTVLGAA